MAARDGHTLKERVAEIRWFHQIDLGDGIVTPGVDCSAAKLLQLGMPDDLAGLSVLDVGAWDGFFSFEAERRGARPGAHMDLTWLRRPALAFYPYSELVDDHTNWCGPNAAAVEGMLKSVSLPRYPGTQESGVSRLAVARVRRR